MKMKIEFIHRFSVATNAINDIFVITLKNGDQYFLRQSIIAEAPTSQEFDYSKDTDYSQVPFVLHTEHVLTNVKTKKDYIDKGLVVLPIIHGDKAVDDDETFNTYTHMTLKELKKPKYPYGLIKDDFFDELA